MYQNIMKHQILREFLILYH